MTTTERIAAIREAKDWMDKLPYGCDGPEATSAYFKAVENLIATLEAEMGAEPEKPKHLRPAKLELHMEVMDWRHKWKNPPIVDMGKVIGELAEIIHRWVPDPPQPEQGVSDEDIVRLAADRVLSKSHTEVPLGHGRSWRRGFEDGAMYFRDHGYLTTPQPTDPDALTMDKQAIMDAAVECFALGPEDQDAALRFGMKLQDMAPTDLAGVVEAGDTMVEYIRDRVHAGLLAKIAAGACIDAWTNATKHLRPNA